MRILVTGARGFVGRHACAVLAARGHTVLASDLPPPPSGDAASSRVVGGPPSPATADAALGGAASSRAGFAVAVPSATGGAGAEPPVVGLPFHPADFTSLESVRALLAATRPDAILHLAGIAFVPVANDHPQLVFTVNVNGPLNLLEAVHRDAPSTRVLLVTSAEVYGNPPSPSAPIAEDAPLTPSNLYGVAKAAADHAARLYAARHNLDLLVARPANHIGPGQSPAFVSSSFARQLKAIADGKAEPVLRVGNLDSVRNFTDVRDVVRAYALLLESGHTLAAYNIASPSPTPIRFLLDTLVTLSGIRPEIQVDPALYRPTDASPAYSLDRIRSHVSWTPSIPLSQTLSDLYASL